MKAKGVGIVIGKFYPFHKGHVSLIERALEKVNKLYIMTCFTDGETIPVTARRDWIQDWVDNHYDGDKEIIVDMITKQLGSSEDGRTSDPIVSKVWAEYLKNRFKDLTHFIGSEPYIEMMADSIGMNSHIIDIDRVAVPISATAIRNNFEQNKHMLATEKVANEYVRRVTIVGIESSGKSTLLNDLAMHSEIKSGVVEEYGRTYCLINSPLDDGKDYFLTRKDFHNIAIGHNRLVMKEYTKCILTGKKLLLTDTDHIVTQCFYKRYLDEKGDRKLQDMCNFQEYDLFLWVDPVEFENDGTRRNITSQERDAQYTQVWNEFKANGVTPVKVEGRTREERVASAIAIMKGKNIIR